MTQRAGTRHDTVFSAKVWDADTGEVIGSVVNISQDGLAIVRKSALEADRVLNLVMELPYRIEGRNQLSLRAQVRWSSDGGAAAGTRVGLFILDADPVRHQIFEELRRNACFSA